MAGPGNTFVAVVAVILGAVACSAAGNSSEREAQEGSMLVFERGDASDARIVVVDRLSGVERVLSNSGQAHVPDLDGDASHLAWGGPNPDDETYPAVFVQDMDSGEVARIGSGGGPRWTLDDEALLVSRSDGLYRLDLDGEASKLDSGSDLSGVEVRPGVFAVSGETLELLDGESRTVVFDEPGCSPFGVDVDPQGKRLAFVSSCEDRQGSLIIYDLDAGTSRIVEQGWFWGIAWSPDGSEVVTAVGKSPDQLWVVDPETGDHEVALDADEKVSWPVWVEAL